MSDERGKIVRRWPVQPLRELGADVPLPYRVAAVGTPTISITLTIGDTVTVDSTGLVRNAHGTPLFRLAALAPGPEDGER